MTAHHLQHGTALHGHRDHPGRGDGHDFATSWVGLLALRALLAVPRQGQRRSPAPSAPGPRWQRVTRVQCERSYYLYDSTIWQSSHKPGRMEGGSLPSFARRRRRRIGIGSRTNTPLPDSCVGCHYVPNLPPSSTETSQPCCGARRPWDVRPAAVFR